MSNIYYFRFVVKNSNYSLLMSFRLEIQSLCNRKKELLGSTRIGSIEQFMDGSFYVMDITDPREDWNELVHIEKLKDIAMHRAIFNGTNALMVDDPNYWPKYGFYDIAKGVVCFNDNESSFYDDWSFYAYTYNRDVIWPYFIAYSAWSPNIINDSNIKAWEETLYGVHNRIQIGKIGMRSLL